MQNDSEALYLRIPAGSRQRTEEACSRLLARKQERLEWFTTMQIEELRQEARWIFADFLNVRDTTLALMEMPTVPPMPKVLDYYNDDFRFLAQHELLQLAQIDDEIERIDNCTRRINQSLAAQNRELAKILLDELLEIIQEINPAAGSND